MSGINSFLHQYGSVALFVASWLEQSGLPLPATPLYVATGVAVGAGEMRWSIAFSSAVAGSLLGDLMWYFLGRWQGQRVLKFLCRMSLEPDSCVRDTEERFLRYGPRSLVIAKFLPGIGTVIRPLAAMAGIGSAEFLLYTGLGTILYIGAFIGLGDVFSNNVDHLLANARATAQAILIILGVGVLLYALLKLYRRQRFLRSLPNLRLGVDELKRRIDGGLSPVIVDLRTPLQIKAFPYSIPGALKIPLQEMERAYSTLPVEREVVLFCNCPNEVSSAKAAQFLQRKGYASAWALMGGIDAWRERNYPIEALS